MIELHIDAETGVAELILNNPKAMNSLGEADLTELSDALDEAANAHPRALILRGEGKGFCAGRNIKGLNPREDDATDFLANKVTPVLRKIDEFPAPTFAAVHGPCLGVGLGVALACDVVYVAEDAKFGSPFANLGATLDSGGHALFVERLGTHRAMDLIITGDLISGAEAVRASLFSRALPAEELLDFARGVAKRAAQGATLAFMASRKLVQDIRDNGTGLWDSVDAENIAQGQLCNTEDYYEGFDAFNEKRKPQFKGA
ncbi:enoyl-CoA hydratase/isomerase family protein [Corynebacterium striatum]|uniref:enoyl-CoA hydratase/isomerase family protein n=1 Tax=Corynebacterium striatum TaxID=43770 RepID=UPI00254B9DB2|nr:enoyl-CoA hydratase-related protein [Corynebacterium striatum]MDK7884901.1 enoyl-CoA hydratase-related protein [Corynebacterium striatum]